MLVNSNLTSMLVLFGYWYKTRMSVITFFTALVADMLHNGGL